MIDMHTLLFGTVDIALYLAPLCFVFFAQVDGHIDALHFDRQQSPHQSFMKDIHVLFTWRRAMFGAVMLLSTGLLMVLACMLMFPMAHDNKYYEVRHDLNPLIYEKGWCSDPSTTSTAVFSLSFRVRSAMCILGLLLAISTPFLK